MAELEKKELDQVDQELENGTPDVESETELTVDDYEKEKARREKAEKALVELKKQLKEANRSPEDIRAILAEEKFYDSNPDAEAYKKEIEKYVAAGIDRKKAYKIASEDDRKVEKTREAYGEGLVGKNTDDSGVTAVTVNQFDSMTPEKQQKYLKDMQAKHGGIKFK